MSQKIWACEGKDVTLQSIHIVQNSNRSFLDIFSNRNSKDVNGKTAACSRIHNGSVGIGSNSTFTRPLRA